MNAELWAERLGDGLDPSLRDELAKDPATAAVKELELSVQLAGPAPLPRRGHRGVCDGMSFLDKGVISYVRSNPGRERFTLLHEVAHHLIHDSRAIQNWLADEPNPRHAEEELCDRFAARILLSPERVDAVSGAGAPRARHVFALAETAGASHAASAIALSNRLGGPGFVMLIDTRSSTVAFASRVGDTRPYPWRGDPIPELHPLHGLGQDGNLNGRARWPGTAEAPEYFLDAAASDGFVSALFAVRNLWTPDQLSVLDRQGERDHPDAQRFRCPTCKTVRWAYPYRCEDCGEFICTSCKQCACNRRDADAKAFCPSCRLRMTPTALSAHGCTTGR
jgi:hypothetical protein